jgi:adenylosuccinate lyase
MIGPDATVTLDFALHRLADMIERLVVHPDAMRRHLDASAGLIHSQHVMLALTKKGLPREDAYRLVQRNAMRSSRGEGTFRDLLLADADVMAQLSIAEIDAAFDLDHHLRHVDAVFDRVFGKS